MWICKYQNSSGFRVAEPLQGGQAHKTAAFSTEWDRTQRKQLRGRVDVGHLPG